VLYGPMPPFWPLLLCSIESSLSCSACSSLCKPSPDVAGDVGDGREFARRVAEIHRPAELIDDRGQQSAGPMVGGGLAGAQGGARLVAAGVEIGLGAKLIDKLPAAALHARERIEGIGAVWAGVAVARALREVPAGAVAHRQEHAGGHARHAVLIEVIKAGHVPPFAEGVGRIVDHVDRAGERGGGAHVGAAERKGIGVAAGRHGRSIDLVGEIDVGVAALHARQVHVCGRLLYSVESERASDGVVDPAG
jgi:hypothetical protein